MAEEIDLREALNAVSDVVQNRPRPLREFDQIYMKAGDMVMQSEFIARWADGKRLAFIGDGDAISVCVMYLRTRGILPYGPESVTVFDFDERICNAITRFADRERLENLDAVLYNCLDPFPATGQFEAFYTNPPWGASNDGESVTVFMQRGMEAVGMRGDGAVVVADDPELPWPRRVLASLQQAALSSAFYVQRMMPQVHSYHLDDAPELRSCNVLLRSVSADGRTAVTSEAITEPERLGNFYGRGASPRVRYVRESAQARLRQGQPDRVRARAARLRAMSEIVHSGAGVLFMKVGTHANEPLEQIVARKQAEIDGAGYALWGYGGNTCHPTTMVQPFARDFELRGEAIHLCMQTMTSNHFAAPERAVECSPDGIDWQTIPAAINVLGSRYALAIDDLRLEELELPLARTRVAVGKSSGRPGDEYVKGRVDKGCLEVVEASTDLADEQAAVEIGLVARLVEPYAVFLRN